LAIPLPTIILHGQQIECSLLIFDMDGTLIDERIRFRALAEARTETMRNLLGDEAVEIWARLSGVNVETGKIDMNGPLARASRRDDLVVAATAIYLSGLRWNDAKELAEKVYGAADELRSSKEGEMLFPGVAETLRGLKKAGLKLSIATNEGHLAAENTMTSLGLHEMFDAFVGADDIANPKPSPDMILMACTMCGCSPAEAVYVGDQPVDMMAGRNAGVKATIAVKSEYVPLSEISKLSDFVIDSINSIRAPKGLQQSEP